MRRVSTLIGLAALILATAIPVGAITSGEPDEGEHPQVGQLLFFVPDAIDSRFDDPGGWFSCSGTLIDDQVVLTAGHCTFAVGLDGESTNPGGDPAADTNDDGVADNGTGGNDVWVSFEEEPDFSILPPSSGFVPDRNDERYEAWRDALNGSDEWHRGTAHPHPDYNELTFLLADAGVVELMSDPGVTAVGALPTLGYLDQFQTAPRHETLFTAVGYGLNSGFPTFGGGDTREKADMMLISLKGTYGVPTGTVAVFSSSPGKGGGTCFGDSGGPVFQEDTNLIVAVTSFGVTFNCVEPGGYYRIDQADDLAFIGPFLNG